MTISRELTDEEVATVERSRKAPDQRPSYFDALTQQLVQISEDMETWVILTPISTRSQLTQFWSTLLASDLNNLPTRNELMLEWLNNEIDDIESVRDGYETIRTQYLELRTALSDSLNGFEDVDEVTRILSDLTLSLGDFMEQSDAIDFEKAVYSVLKARVNNSDPSSLQQEIESWQQVLLAYS